VSQHVAEADRDSREYLQSTINELSGDLNRVREEGYIVNMVGALLAAGVAGFVNWINTEKRTTSAEDIAIMSNMMEGNRLAFEIQKAMGELELSSTEQARLNRMVESNIQKNYAEMYKAIIDGNATVDQMIKMRKMLVVEYAKALQGLELGEAELETAMQALGKAVNAVTMEKLSWIDGLTPEGPFGLNKVYMGTLFEDEALNMLDELITDADELAADVRRSAGERFGEALDSLDAFVGEMPPSDLLGKDYELALWYLENDDNPFN